MIGAVVCLGASETSVEVVTRTQAARQFDGYCNFRRDPTLSILANGLSDWLASPHATLTGRTHAYLWSFTENSWVVRDACPDLQCWCFKNGVGLPRGRQVPAS